MALLENKDVYAWGSNEYGATGLGKTEGFELLPCLVKKLCGKSIVQISTYDEHTAALSDFGEVFTFGNGYYGRLGHEFERREVIPRSVEALADKHVNQVECGCLHTAAVTSTGEVYTWGFGWNGQLGHGDTDGKLVPTLIEALAGKAVVRITCGGNHTIALTDTGEVYTWGGGYHGSLGHNDTTMVTLPKLVTALEGKRVASVASFYAHTLALVEPMPMFPSSKLTSSCLGGMQERIDNAELSEDTLVSGLLSAAWMGNVEAVRRALQAGEDVETRDITNQDETPLIWAATRGHVEVVKLLLDENSHIDAQTKFGSTALMRAADYGRVEVVQILLERGADVGLTSSEGYTPLMHAASNGHLHVVELLLAWNADLSPLFFSWYRTTPFGLPDTISATDVVSMVEFFREQGPSLEPGPPVAIERLQVNGLTLQPGLPVARRQQTTPNAGPYLGESSSLPKSESAPRNEEFPAEGKSPEHGFMGNQLVQLLEAADQGHLQDVQDALGRDGDINARDESGRSPLVLAAASGHLDAVLFLLDHGADIDLASREGDTPLKVALHHGHLEVVRLLLERGARMNPQNVASATPSQKTELGGRKETVGDFQEPQQREAQDLTDDSTDAWEAEPAAVSSATASTEMEDPSPLEEYQVKPQHGDAASALTPMQHAQKLYDLVEMSQHMAETNDMCGDVVQRLLETQHALIEMRDSAPPKDQEAVVDISARFRAFLTQHGEMPTVERLVSTRTVIDVLREFHHELDVVDTRVPPRQLSGPQVDWKQLFDEKVLEVEERLAQALETDAGDLLSELPTIESQTNALLLLNCEHSRHESKYSTKSQELLNSTTSKVIRLSGAAIPAVPEWFIPNHEVQRAARSFARGGFGEVFRGTWRGKRVVIKCVEVNSVQDTRTFKREAKVWRKARHHPNIVSFFGACHITTPCFFVCEEATNGNLVDFLYRNKSTGRSLIWRMLYQAALGLHFLHLNGIVHGDLKCNQILVNSEGVAMLTDFGLSFFCNESRPAAPKDGAVRWKAPEFLLNDSAVPTPDSDLFSLGMCIVEAVTNTPPWGPWFLDEAIIDKYRRREFLSRPSAFQNEEWELVTALCAFEPSKRMRLEDAIDRMKEFADVEEL